MSIWLILSLLLLIGGIVTVVACMFAANGGGAAAGAGCILLAFVVFFLAGFKEVPAKNVGVMVNTGKVEGFLTPGLHHTWPWKRVVLIPETIQTSTFEGGWDKNGNCQGLDVRIGGQQQGCLDATIQWQVRDAAASNLFNNYNTGSQPPVNGCDHLSGGAILIDICNAVVVREFKVAVNQVLGDYNPIQDVALNSGAGNSQFSTFGPKVTAVMQKDIGVQITVRPVLLPFLYYDAATQARLNSIQQQYGDTAIAQQAIKTNQAQAAANAAIARSVLSPGVLTQECYDITKLAVKEHVPMDTGWNCVGSGALALSGK
jgi:regulator of protease activity HflC (stomatin/prohibitin superfamily)